MGQFFLHVASEENDYVVGLQAMLGEEEAEQALVDLRGRPMTVLDTKEVYRGLGTAAEDAYRQGMFGGERRFYGADVVGLQHPLADDVDMHLVRVHQAGKTYFDALSLDKQLELMEEHHEVDQQYIH
jgi:hypothetical protein